MLIVDLGRLPREGRLRLEQDIEPDDPIWNGLEFRLSSPVHVRLDALPAGGDVLVQGRFTGSVAHECRRCLEPLAVSIAENFSMFFKSGVPELEAEAQEAYALPERGDLDLAPAVREHVALAVPRFALCREDCLGLCPTCGVNRNTDDCECVTEEIDDRWAALRRINFE